MDALGIDQKLAEAKQEKPLAEVSGSYTYFAEGDVLLAKITPCFENGKLGIASNLTNGAGFGSSEYIVLRPKPAVSREWLYYLLLREDFRKAGTKSMSGAVGHKRVAAEFIESYPIPVPPLAEQKRIVGILDKAFDGIATAKANAERNQENARGLFESVECKLQTHKRSGWQKRKLGDVCQISSMLVDPRDKSYRDLLHVGAGNIESGTGQLFELKTAKDEGLISGKFPFDPSMVLYSKIRPYLMKVARPDFEGLCSADMYPLAPNADLIDRNYLYHLLLSKDFTDYAIQGSARAGMPKVNREHLFAYQFLLPPMKQQLEIAKALDSVKSDTVRLASNYERKKLALDSLKQSLLHQAFTGAL